MNEWLSTWLRCPFCGGRLKWFETSAPAAGSEYGILTCYCGRYPVLDGIPVLKKGASIDEATVLVERGCPEEALFSLLRPPIHFGAPAANRIVAALKRLAQFTVWKSTPETRSPDVAFIELLRQAGQVSVQRLLRSYFFDKPENSDYFFYRFSQPRYLVAISFASIIDRPNAPILDLACGCGHLIHNVLQRARGQRVAGVDRFLFGLYIAKHITAPQATYVCCDIDTALPFADEAFEVVLCSDAFHYFAHKKSCIRELRRLIRRGGFFILVWNHSANVRMAHEGFSLPPEGYEQLVADMPHRIIGDSRVLARYLQRLGPPLARSSEAADLINEPLVSLVASDRPEIFRDYGRFEEWPHVLGNVGINPLYTVSRMSAPGRVSIRCEFPSAFYENEHAQSKDYMPERVDVPAQVLEDLARSKRTPQIEELIRQFVILGMPEHYVPKAEVCPIPVADPPSAATLAGVSQTKDRKGLSLLA